MHIGYAGIGENMDIESADLENGRRDVCSIPGLADDPQWPT